MNCRVHLTSILISLPFTALLSKKLVCLKLSVNDYGREICTFWDHCEANWSHLQIGRSVFIHWHVSRCLFPLLCHAVDNASAPASCFLLNTIPCWPLFLWFRNVSAWYYLISIHTRSLQPFLNFPFPSYGCPGFALIFWSSSEYNIFECFGLLHGFQSSLSSREPSGDRLWSSSSSSPASPLRSSESRCPCLSMGDLLLSLESSRSLSRDSSSRSLDRLSRSVSRVGDVSSRSLDASRECDRSSRSLSAEASRSFDRDLFRSLSPDLERSRDLSRDERSLSFDRDLRSLRSSSFDVERLRESERDRRRCERERERLENSE